jgi:hypothetical protein
MKIIRIALAGLAAAALLAIAGFGPELASSAEPDSGKGITVTGSGDVRSTPNRADLTFSAHSEGSTAAQALARNSAKLNRLIAALKAAGVAAADMRTDHLGVSPRYDGERETTDGYAADASLTVSQQGLDRASRLIDIGVAAGADSVSGPSLSTGDRDEQYRRALEAAFDDARKKAKALANAAGVSLGDVTAIAEGSQPNGGPVVLAAERAVGDSKTPIEPGTEQITAVVTVTFAIS